MSEADILGLRNDTTGLVISIVSVSFGMISAYIVGLWLFLRNVPITLRAIAFSMLSCGMAFMGGIAWGLHETLLGTDRAWAGLEKTATGIPDFGGSRPDYLMGLSLYEFATLLGFFAFSTIYVALAYMTFRYRWPDIQRGNQDD